MQLNKKILDWFLSKYKPTELQEIFFDKFNYTIEPKYISIINSSTIKLSSIFSLFISILTLIILLFMLQPQEWLSITQIMSLLSFNP